MALPILPCPEKTLTLPLSKLTVTARAWRVGEEKLLLMAEHSKQPGEIQSALNQILRRVTNDEVQLNILPLADIEYLFLNVRALSVDEIVNRSYRCQKMVDDKKCDTLITVKIPILNAVVEAAPGHNKILSFQTPGTPNIDLEMRYPTIEDAAFVMQLPEEPTFEDMQPLVKSCIRAITVGETVEDPSKATEAEWTAFFESLHLTHLEALLHFFETMPRLVIHVPVVCPGCHTETEVIIKGIRQLFH